jgi:hypothetical protein
MDNWVVGLTGVAGCGKDTFFKIFSDLLSKRGIKTKRYSLADALKREVSEWTKEHYGIDAANCSREEKEIIRSFLVFHGSQKRLRTEGRHWINTLDNVIKSDKLSDDTIIVITDIRYDDYPKDEAYWLQEEIGGVLVHVSLYEMIPRLNTNFKKYKEPANPEEERNDPKLINKTNYKIEWPVWDESQECIQQELSHHVEDFITWLSDAHGLTVNKEDKEKQL